MVKIWRKETININLKKIFSYRAEISFEFIDVIFAVIINYYIWSAFKPGVNVLGYVLTIAAMISITHRGVIDNIFTKYRTGSIVFDLIRPKKFHSIIFWQWIGSILSDEILVLPIIILAFLFNPNIYFFISMFLSVYFKFLIGFIASCVFYESIYSWGVSGLMSILIYITGGGIPYFLMPEIIKKLMLFNPLFYAMAAPWVAQHNPTIIIWEIIFIILMVAVALFLEKRMVKNLTTVGV